VGVVEGRDTFPFESAVLQLEKGRRKQRSRRAVKTILEEEIEQREQKTRWIDCVTSLVEVNQAI